MIMMTHDVTTLTIWSILNQNFPSRLRPSSPGFPHKTLFHELHVEDLSWFFFFFNDTATTEIYTLSLHDALPILGSENPKRDTARNLGRPSAHTLRSEEHTSELQSLRHLVCRLLLEKKKNKK